MLALETLKLFERSCRGVVAYRLRPARSGFEERRRGETSSPSSKSADSSSRADGVRLVVLAVGEARPSY